MNTQEITSAEMSIQEGITAAANKGSSNAYVSFSKYENKGYLDEAINDIVYYLGVQRNNEGHYRSGDSAAGGSDHGRRVDGQHDNQSFYSKRPPFVDGTLGVVHMQATQNIIQSILPAGAESVSVSLFKEGEKGKKRFLKNESTLLTDQLRLLFEKPSLQLKHVLHRLLEDFTMYGNCVLEVSLEWETPTYREDTPNLEFSKLRLSALDFTSTYFKLADGSNNIVWVYNKTTTHDGDECEVIHKVWEKTFFGVWQKHTYTTVHGAIKSQTTFTYPEDMPAIIICKEGRYYKSSYGMGSGVVALPFVKALNWTISQAMYSVEKTVEPPIFVASGVRFMGDAYGLGVMDLRPGGLTEYEIDAELIEQTRLSSATSPLYHTAKAEPIDMQFQQIMATQSREQIQSVFFIDPILGVGVRGGQTARTATEILQRESQSLILYRGKAEAFKVQLLTPLMNTIIKIELETLYNKVVSRIGDFSIEVKYMSLDTRRGKELNLERREKTLAVLAQIAPDSLDNELIEEYKKEATEELV